MEALNSSIAYFLFLKQRINPRLPKTRITQNGLDAVICDVTDEELVNTILTAELVMNKSIYADSYIEAFRA